jgi:predicted kinase
LFFDVLQLLLAGGVTVVAEAAFQDRLWRPRLEGLGELAELRIVQCHVDAAVAHARRRTEPGAHARVGDAVEDWELASFDRVAVAAPSIDVDTTEGYSPSLDEIIDFVNGGAGDG